MTAHETARDQINSARNFAAGFTLIELLVVISIIGLLAALTLGVTGVATRNMKESRIRSEMNQLITKIEAYNGAHGFYPPDNQFSPGTNQLFYELSGAIFQSTPTPRFQVINSAEVLPSGTVTLAFGANGIANSSRDPKELRYQGKFKPDEHKGFTVKSAAKVELLVAPVDRVDGQRLPNPWNYLAKPHATNNPESFDLWLDAKIGKKNLRFANWSKTPIPLP